MHWRLTIGLLAAALAAATSASAQDYYGAATPAQFGALPPGAPLNRMDLPPVPTVELGRDFHAEGGIGETESVDAYGGGYGYGGNVYLPQRPDRGFPLPRVRPIRPPDLSPPPVFDRPMGLSPPAASGQRVRVGTIS